MINVYSPYYNICWLIFQSCRCAEAPSKHVVELARAEVRSNPAASDEMKEFSQIRLEDAESGVHQVLKRHGLSAPVKVDKANVGEGELKAFPYILFSTWVQYLGLKRICRQLVGVPGLAKLKQVLQEFWERYQCINPGHQIFEMAASNQVDLRFVIPIYSHSDEGRSYKKEALWIFSVHGCLGRGTRHYLRMGRHRAPLRRNQMGLNFVGQSWSTQFLFATMLRETANANPGALKKILSIFSSDAATLARDGIIIEGQRFWFLHLNSKGDLPALVKCGQFKRTFSHCPRAPSSKRHCTGICHQCLAGQEASEDAGTEAFPFEDLSNAPCWEPTIETTLPWNETPDLMVGLPINPLQPSKFFAFDVWHLFHLGIAKHYLGSCFVTIVESDLPALARFRSIDAKFTWISEKYREYCKANKLSTWVKSIDRDSLQWPQSSATPIGKWNKGAASTALMLFLGDFCKSYFEGHTENESLLLIASWFLS